MWINAMSSVARRKGITIPDLLKQQQGIGSKQGKPSKGLERSPTKKDAFEGLSTRELYLRRPMD